MKKKVVYKLLVEDEVVKEFEELPTDEDLKDYMYVWKENAYGKNSASTGDCFSSYYESVIRGVEIYKLVPFEWDRSKKDYIPYDPADMHKYYIKCYIHKSNSDKFTKVEDNYIPLVEELIRNGCLDNYMKLFTKRHTYRYYVSKEIYKGLEDIKKPHVPYVVKGTNFPYYFKICGKMVKSTTTNYYKFISDWVGVLPEFVEEYKGEELSEKEKVKYLKTEIAARTNNNLNFR